MFPSLVPKPPSNPRPVSNDMPTGGRPLVDHHREVIEELRANAGEGMSSMMRALRRRLLRMRAMQKWRMRMRL